MKTKNELTKIRSKARGDGRAWERTVRSDLEKDGWIVDKWSKNVEFKNDDGILITAKRTFNPFKKVLALGTGFPDFIAYKIIGDINGVIAYNVIGVECKLNGYLRDEERQKCLWLINHKIFSKILIASKSKQGRCVVVVFKEVVC